METYPADLFAICYFFKGAWTRLHRFPIFVDYPLLLEKYYDLASINETSFVPDPASLMPPLPPDQESILESAFLCTDNANANIHTNSNPNPNALTG